jgi:hypothetical protein
MKRIHLLAALCVVLFPMLLNAQQFAEISGQVSDKSNLRPLGKAKGSDRPTDRLTPPVLIPAGVTALKGCNRAARLRLA